MDHSLMISEQFYGPYYSHNMTCHLLSEATVLEKKNAIYDTLEKNDPADPMNAYLGFFVAKDARRGFARLTRWRRRRSS